LSHEVTATRRTFNQPIILESRKCKADRCPTHLETIGKLIFGDRLSGRKVAGYDRFPYCTVGTIRKLFGDGRLLSRGHVGKQPRPMLVERSPGAFPIPRTEAVRAGGAVSLAAHRLFWVE
jgi:hypothetical protein